MAKVRIGSPKTAQNEQVCMHKKSYRKYIFQNNFGANMHVRDRSCAPILRFFSAASDGATHKRSLRGGLSPPPKRRSTCIVKMYAKCISFL